MYALTQTVSDDDMLLQDHTFKFSWYQYRFLGWVNCTPIIIPIQNDVSDLQLSARFKRYVDIDQPT